MQPKNDLSERAMLVNLTVSVWLASRKDKIVSGEVKSEKHAAADAGSWTTRFVPKVAFARINAARSQLITAHQSVTLPWMDGGIRILPSALFMQYTEAIRKAESKFNKAVDEFMAAYPFHYSSAQERLGDLANTLPMPSLEEVRTKFGVEKQTLPMPSGTDFRVDLGDERTAQIKKKVEKSIAEMTDKAVKSLYTQLAKVVGKMVTTLGKKDAKFKDSLVNNITTLCDSISVLNITDDPKLEQLRKECAEKLTKLKPDSLRKQPRTRAKAAKTAEEIMEQIQQFSL